MARFPWLASLAFGITIIPVALQATEIPTAAQKHAIRSNCVSDYRAHCSSVPTGGMAALVCLEQHQSSLSPACQSAVKAVEGGSKSATSTPATGAPAAKEKRADKAPKTAGTAESKTAPATAADTFGGASRPALPFIHELRIAARACATDFRLFCPNVPLGRGNAIFCLKVHGPRLAPACRAALTEAGERF
jgi:hypothetical protein